MMFYKKKLLEEKKNIENVWCAALNVSYNLKQYAPALFSIL